MCTWRRKQLWCSVATGTNASCGLRTWGLRATIQILAWNSVRNWSGDCLFGIAVRTWELRAVTDLCDSQAYRTGCNEMTARNWTPMQSWRRQSAIVSMYGCFWKVRLGKLKKKKCKPFNMSNTCKPFNACIHLIQTPLFYRWFSGTKDSKVHDSKRNNCYYPHKIKVHAILC